jgi:hypothetical protein
MGSLMHRIVKAHLDSFVKSRGLEAEDESVQFEKFVNNAVISSRFSSSYDIDDITTGKDAQASPHFSTDGEDGGSH